MSSEFPREHLSSLWAPWRVEYFEAEHKAPNDFLLIAAQSTDDAANLVVARCKSAFLIMNKYPYSAGHLMAVPYRKVAEMTELSEDEAIDIWRMCNLAQQILKKVVKAQGFNVGVNLGKVAGAGFAEHLHFHIVPRWAGDSNFMPVIGETRILPEALEPLYVRLVEARDEILASK